MDGKIVDRGTGSTTRWGRFRGGGTRRQRIVVPGWCLAVMFGLLVAVPPAGRTDAAEPDTEPGNGGRIELRPARPPAASERERVRRWYRVWRVETRPIEELLGPLGAAEQPARVGNPRWCRALAESLIALDRERALAGPCRAADLHLRRGIDRLVLGAAACLEGRLHAAAYRIREAHWEFADADRLLRPYLAESSREGRAAGRRRPDRRKFRRRSPGGRP